MIKYLTDNRLAHFISFRSQILTLPIFIFSFYTFSSWLHGLRDTSRIQDPTIRNEMNVLERGIKGRKRKRKRSVAHLSFLITGRS